MGATVAKMEIDWSIDFSDEKALDKWCVDYNEGLLLDAPKVRQFIGVLSYVWDDGMRTLLRQCHGLLRQRKCSCQAVSIDGVEKSVFTLGEAVRLFGDGGVAFRPEGFMAEAYCTLSYGERDVTMLCWAGTDISHGLLCLCDAFGFDISIMPERRYGNVYDIVAKCQMKEGQK